MRMIDERNLEDLHDAYAALLTNAEKRNAELTAALEVARRERVDAILRNAEHIRQVTEQAEAERDAAIAKVTGLQKEVEQLCDLFLDADKKLERWRDTYAKSRWRPISEAPKDNAGIEAIDSRTGFVRVVDYYKGYAPLWIPCWMLQGASNEAYPLSYFTHYRPIPDPPEGA